ncbi:MAG: hypothetical protein V4447_16350 [Pseudomonadota bacterium]
MHQELDQLSFRFFKLFARYESSLKEKDFFTLTKGKLTVDRDRFANEVIGSAFLEKLDNNRHAAEYILENPPKKQSVNEHGKIVWPEVPNNERSVQILFAHISRIRNNLYHGAKFNGNWFDPERSGLVQLGVRPHEAADRFWQSF